MTTKRETQLYLCENNNLKNYIDTYVLVIESKSFAAQYACNVNDPNFLFKNLYH